MDNCIKTGAYVNLVDYGAYGPADIFAVGDKRVVKFNGDIEQATSFTAQRPVTHMLYLNEGVNYWDKKGGTAVVDQSDLIETTNEENT